MTPTTEKLAWLAYECRFYTNSLFNHNPQYTLGFNSPVDGGNALGATCKPTGGR